MASKFRNASHKSPSNNLTKPSQSLFFLFCLTSVKSTSSFFLCLVIQKIASYNSYLEAAED